VIRVAIAERQEAPRPGPPETVSTRRRTLGALSFRTIGAVYIFIALFVLFSIWVPSTFLQWSTWQSLFASQSITALTAVALTIPLAAGAPNLAIGTQVGIGSIVAAWLLANQGLSIPLTILLTLISGALIGCATAFLIVRLRIDAFVATLGLSSVLTALTDWISNSQSILNLGTHYQDLATNEVFGLTIPVYVVLVVGSTPPAATSTLRGWPAFGRQP
jgi:ribose transport system permease protein